MSKNKKNGEVKKETWKPNRKVTMEVARKEVWTPNKNVVYRFEARRASRKRESDEQK